MKIRAVAEQGKLTILAAYVLSVRGLRRAGLVVQSSSGAETMKFVRCEKTLGSTLSIR